MISAFKLVLTLVVLAIAMSSLTNALGQNQWTRYGSTPILSTPSWAPGGLFRPRVTYDGKIFRMWFGGFNATGNVLGIGYATSTDGIKWVENTQPVMTAGSSPENWTGYGPITGITIGSVIWTGSQFMMWYRASSSASHRAAVGLATSADGITWTKYAGNPVMIPTTVDSTFISTPYVIQVGSSFKMWYTCSNPNLPSGSRDICSATSNDGISWTKQSTPVLQLSSGWEAGYIYSPTVIYDGTTYGMWYSGCNSSSSAVCQIGYATSKDGITWTRDPNNPILSSGLSGAWDAGGVENQCAVQYNGGILLYYDGYPTSAIITGVPSYIGLAQSPANFSL